MILIMVLNMALVVSMILVGDTNMTMILIMSDMGHGTDRFMI